MLGKLIGHGQWSWSAFGKHPSARDYFQIHMQSPLAAAFGQWVENGFGRMDEQARRNGLYSWRFWSRGLKKGTLICGLGKSSGDGIGRPYPLMLLGEGQLRRWEQHWHLLPFALRPVWEKMEYASARRLTDITELEADLARMKAPVPAWQEILESKTGDFDADNNPPVNKIIMDKIQEKSGMLAVHQKLAVTLDQGGRTDPLIMAGAWHQALKSYVKGPPNTVFMGGRTDRSWVVFFNRPLIGDDFVDLWSQ